jgi:uncharacterized protein
MALIDIPMSEPDAPFELSLFPLRTVLFPQGLLALKVFEVRYLDLITQCLREEKPFGVVGLREGGEVRASSTDAVSLEAVGTLAHLIDVDGDQPGILHVRCLWQCEAMLLDDDDAVPPSPAEQGSVAALNRAIDSMRKAGTLQCLEPYHFDDAGWVADRWCELLPISRAARQKLLELDDPALRLKLVDDFLRQRKVID